MRAGFVAVAGRPNVGKSSLFNRMLGPKLAIVSHRRQTTRYCVRGIVNTADAQIALVDTPGWQTALGGALNASLRRRAEKNVPSADVGLLVVEGSRLRSDDRKIAGLVPRGLPMVVAFNKLDLVRRREELLPVIREIASWREVAALVPVSAKTGEGVQALIKELAAALPESPALFPVDMLTDLDTRMVVADFIREKLFRYLGAELPYAVAVELRQFVTGPRGSAHIAADILVDKRSRQAMVVGAGGRRLKLIGTGARIDIERFLGGKVRLELRVVFRRGWQADVSVLARLGLLESRH